MAKVTGLGSLHRPAFGVTLGRVRPFLLCQHKGRPGCCREVSPVKLHWGKNLTFLFFQSFFRGHKYLWRACQSSLGFLTECVTREGLLWWFIVNCSKLLSCQGAQRSYTMPGDAGKVPRMPEMLWGEMLPAQGTLWSLGTSQVSLQSSNCREAWLGETLSSGAEITANVPNLAGQSLFLDFCPAEHSLHCTGVQCTPPAGLVPSGVTLCSSPPLPASNRKHSQSLTAAGFGALKGCRSGPDISM